MKGKREQYKKWEEEVQQWKKRNDYSPAIHDLTAKTVRYMSLSCGYVCQWRFEDWYFELLQKKRYEEVNQLIYQEMKDRALPGNESGYDQCSRCYAIIASYACGAQEEVFERILPYELGLSKNGFTDFVIVVNLLMSVYYHDEDMKKNSMERAEKFIGGKDIKWWRMIVAFLVNLMKKDIEQASENLKQICKGYRRLETRENMEFCIVAHGLYCIAKSWLEPMDFEQIRMPDEICFSKEYANWRMQNPKPVLKPYITYPEEMEIVNQVFAMPVAKSIVKQEKHHSVFVPVLDDEEMYRRFVEELRNLRKVMEKG